MTTPSLLDELEGVVRRITDDVAEVRRTGGDPERERHTQRIAANFIRTHHAEIADMAKRLDAAERDARGERGESWEIWQDDMCMASSDRLADAQHYMLMYGQDGPVKLVRVISYRETVTPDAIAAATQEGEE